MLKEYGLPIEPSADLETIRASWAAALREQAAVPALAAGPTRVMAEFTFRAAERPGPPLAAWAGALVQALQGAGHAPPDEQIAELSHTVFLRQLRDGVRVCLQQAATAQGPVRSGGMIVRDAVHGDIELSPLEERLINTPDFQRLHGIRQLGVAYHIYPTALHTRFDHVLGSCWMSKILLSHLERRGYRFARDEKELISVACLLHDITHIPFAHTIEDEWLVYSRHDESPKRIDTFLREGPIAETLGGLRDEVIRILTTKRAAQYRKPFIVQMVSGAICADLLDYLRRDAYFTGLAQNYDDRIFRYLAVEDDQLYFEIAPHGVIREDAISELVNLLRIRYALTERVYFHHAKLSLGGLVAKAVELVRDVVPEERYYRMTDDELVRYLATTDEHHCDEARLLAQRLLARDHYRRAYILSPHSFGDDMTWQRRVWEFSSELRRNPARRQELEATIAAEVGRGLRPVDVLAYCADPDVSLKEAQVNVQVGTGRIVPLSSLNLSEVASLMEKHRRLWRFYVFVHSGDPRVLAAVGRVCERLFERPNEYVVKG